jgi:signal transduction histidine kinase
MSDHTFLLYILGSMVLMLVFALVIVFFFNFSQKKITDSKLKVKEIELNFQRELLENTINTQETERDRIAKDLHDEVASKLNIIHLNLHLLKQKIPGNEDTAQLLLNISQSLKESTERTRSISYELMPPLLKKFGIQHVLNDLAEAVNNTRQIEFEMVNSHLIGITEHIQMLHIYRIVQELLNNTLKYAQARRATLHFNAKENSMLEMVYSDDGIGFDPQAQKHGYGLSNIETRIHLLKGSLHIDSQPQKGVTFTFMFPNHDRKN